MASVADFQQADALAQAAEVDQQAWLGNAFNSCLANVFAAGESPEINDSLVRGPIQCDAAGPDMKDDMKRDIVHRMSMGVCIKDLQGQDLHEAEEQH